MTPLLILVPGPNYADIDTYRIYRELDLICPNPEVVTVKTPNDENSDRWNIQRNERANKEYQLHTVVWTEEEEERLRKAVAGYGSSWVQVASAISGRTNDQCREKWHEQINSSTEKSTWTEAEDKILLENVKLIGNRWKSIGLKIGNNRSGAAVSPRVCYQVIFQDSPSVSIALRQVDEIAKFSK